MSKPVLEVDLTGFGLERLEHIGKGQYATAQLVRETATGNIFVAKCISLAVLDDHDQDLAHQEVFLLQTLSHPYIVTYKDSFLIEGANTLVIVMEHCGGGDLRKAIKEKAKVGEYFPEDQIMTWFVQLSLALQYIHSEKVLHRDLKTSNIFLSEDGSIKLGDFGISRVLEGTTEAAVTIVGTPYYMSPEVCRSEPYNWKSDIWALGCVLYELCMLRHAFESTSLLGLVYKIVSDNYEPIPAHYSRDLNGLITSLLHKSAESRPSINELFANPYVKAYVERQEASKPSVEAPLPPSGHSTKPGRRTSLQPVAAPPPPPLPPHPPPPPLDSIDIKTKVQIIAARIRRRLVGQRLNWISAFACYDDTGDGKLTDGAMRSALMAMGLGLSEDEMTLLIACLAPALGERISLDSFGAAITEVVPEVQQYELWAREVVSHRQANEFREMLQAVDVQLLGTLPEETFKNALRETGVGVTEGQLDILALLADKNLVGDVDYMEFANFYAGVAPPPAPALPVDPPPPPDATNCGRPEDSLPPLPIGTETDPYNRTMNMGDIMVTPRTFFTCTATQLMSAAASYGRTLSAEGCGIVFSRIRRRLESAGVAIEDVLRIFAAPGSNNVTSEQWLEASMLPLGTSRAEMQLLFSKLDADESDHVPIETFAMFIERANSADCMRAPAWIGDTFWHGLGDYMRDEFIIQSQKGSKALTLARESDFRRVVMQRERILTTDQINSLILLADKNASGLIDYGEFSTRFTAGAVGPLLPPGGAPTPPPGGPVLLPAGAGPTEDELVAVGSRSGAVLERIGLRSAALVGVLALHGGALSPSLAAAFLASLPLGLSRQEAAAQLQVIGGDVPQLAARFESLRAQGFWRANCEWAAANINGNLLRDALQNEVLKAEIRTLDRVQFGRALLAAGVSQQNLARALWLAEKTATGEICVAEYLANFGGPPPAPTPGKKKRGLFDRIMGR